MTFSNPDSKQDYIQYLRQVLGISQVLVDQKTDLIPQRLIVWVEDLNVFSKQDQELLFNMLSAMKIDKNDIAIFNLQQKSEIASRLKSSCIQFELVRNPIDKASQTFSPQMLHDNKQLKSEAWTFLQQMITRYASQTGHKT